ncbi:MAG TPA: hypothetical protein H9898_02700 [Candidatus Anaerobiospirillum stercoravium]|nr:hypothetical protein [Candidatus Anaerobiospirillum stercoravium]
MTSLIQHLSAALATALPHHLMASAQNAITIYPNSIHFSNTNGGVF